MLDDLLAHGLKVVICGAAVGHRSAEVGAYYANPSNQFWQTLHAVGLTPRRLRPAEYRELLTFGIGLTDAVKDQVGRDAEVHFGRDVPDVLTGEVRRYRPAYLCFNGVTPARTFFGRRDVSCGLQQERVGTTGIFVAPSTSGAARGYWDIQHWHDLAALVGFGR